MHTKEQAEHLALQLDATMVVTRDRVLETVRESPEYVELGIDDELALTVLKTFIMAYAFTGLGPALAATLFAPHNRLALLMGTAVEGTPVGMAGGVGQIIHEAKAAGWGKRELKHLETLTREFQNATTRLAPLAERLERDINRRFMHEGGQEGAAEA